MKATISIRNLQKRIRISPSQIARITKQILRHEHIKDADLSFVFVSDRKIKSLNKKYLKRDCPTDVLAFDFSKKPKRSKSKELLGEVVISTDTVVKNSRLYKTTQGEELTLYIIHGILHLIGYDDHKPADKKQMRAKEEKLLNLVTR